MRAKVFLTVMLLAGMLPACQKNNPPASGATIKIQMSSTAFADGQAIPSRHAYNDDNLSPALQWSGLPDGTKSLALICDDPDAPAGTWVHWVIYRLPAATTGLTEGAPKSPELTSGARQGVNDFGKTGYDGPSPPPGKPHRYYFKLYALDAEMDLKAGVKKSDLLKAMEGHVLAQGQLMGTYQR